MGRIIEVAVGGAVDAGDADRGAVDGGATDQFEDLDAVIAAIGHKQMAGAVQRYAAGIVEMAVIAAGGPIGRELLLKLAGLFP